MKQQYWWSIWRHVFSDKNVNTCADVKGTTYLEVPVSILMEVTSFLPEIFSEADIIVIYILIRLCAITL
jgi:hypothetical protein